MTETVPFGGLMIEIIVQGLREVQAVRYGRIASCALLAYDYACTFDFEVELIWKNGWSPIQVLLLFYGGYVLCHVCCECPVYRNGSQLVNAEDCLPEAPLLFYSCVILVRVEMFTVFSGPILTACILQARIYALYGRDKKVLIVMVTFYLITLILTSWVLVTNMVQATSTVIIIPGGEICPFPPLSKISYGLWLPAIIFESGLFSMVLYKGYQSFKYYGGKNKPVALVKTLVLDSAIYFIVLTVSVHVTCLVVWLTASIGYLEIPASTSVSMTCILGSRMFFNLRQAAIEQQPSSTRNVIPLIVRRGGAESRNLMLETGRK